MTIRPMFTCIVRERGRIAAVEGGFDGVGLMEGKQKLFYLPEAHTDFIFAVVGEEMGMIGTGVILMLFSLFLWRGLRASIQLLPSDVEAHFGDADAPE